MIMLLIHYLNFGRATRKCLCFLITNNVDKVLPTIKSRCQIIYVDNVEENCLDLYSTDDIICTLNLIDLIEKKSILFSVHL